MKQSKAKIIDWVGNGYENYYFLSSEWEKEHLDYESLKVRQLKKLLVLQIKNLEVIECQF